MDLGFFEGQSGSVNIGPRFQAENGAILQSYCGRITAGRNVFIGPHTVIYGHGGVEIVDNTSFSMRCRILSSNHAIPPLGTAVRSVPDRWLPTRIGRDVWLGAGVTVLGGVTIADGCIVGAGSVVTRDLPAGAIGYGAPAVIKSHREGSPRS